MQEAKSFYQNLYSTRMNQANLSHEDFFPPNSRKGPDKQSKKECEGLLTDVEFLESLKTMPFKNVRIKKALFIKCPQMQM